MKIRRLHLILLLFIAALIGYYFGVNKVSLDWKNYQPHISVINKEPPNTIPTADFSLFWTVWEKLENSYYDKMALDPQKLIDGAISGMVGSLGDPYTVFLPPNKNTDFKNGLAGQFEGIGAELGMNGKQIIVIAPLSQTPAEKAGIKAGDAIIKINGNPTAGLTLLQAVDKIRGPKGTAVVLTISRKNQTREEEIKIIRGTIRVKSVEAKIKNLKVESGKLKAIDQSDVCADCLKIAYIRLSQFGDNTNQEWLEMVNKLSLQIKNDNRVKGAVLDLRNNPGGYLTDASFVASEFLRDGVVVIQDKGNNVKQTFSVNRKGILLDIPLAVLINKGSASASEIVAGALRDHKRATLVGEQSFGKGTIQQAEDLGGGGGLHITIAKWLTPNGNWVNGKGLTPDVAVAFDEKDPSKDTQLEKAAEFLLK